MEDYQQGEHMGSLKALRTRIPWFQVRNMEVVAFGTQSHHVGVLNQENYLLHTHIMAS